MNFQLAVERFTRIESRLVLSLFFSTRPCRATYGTELTDLMTQPCLLEIAEPWHQPPRPVSAVILQADLVLLSLILLVAEVAAQDNPRWELFGG